MISRPSIMRPYPTGACAPSEEALKSARPLVLDDLSKPERLNRPTYRDLVEKQRYAHWPARIQGQRQTCIAFAAAACIELLRAGDGRRFELLSPQFLYWHMRALALSVDRPPGWETGATKLADAKDVLIEKGICAWSACPYMDRLGPGEPKPVGPEPTREADSAAAENRIVEVGSEGTFYFNCPDPKRREPGVAKMVYNLLAKKRPVAIAIPVFYSTRDSLETNWDNPSTTNSGQVVDPVEPDWTPRDPDSQMQFPPGHAVCVIGFQPDDGEPTGGWFIFRNSRGINWAAHIDTENQEPPIVPARGYGAISATYIERYCWEILSPVMRH